jgi:hypothetical protein
MSGSGGSSGRFGTGIGGGSSSDDCGSLVVDTTLNSPVQSVVSALKSGDQLDVSIETSPTKVKTLVAKATGGRIAGSLTPLNIVAIINCIEDGYEYIAILLDDPSGGLVRVRIQGRP